MSKVNYTTAEVHYLRKNLLLCLPPTFNIPNYLSENIWSFYMCNQITDVGKVIKPLFQNRSLIPATSIIYNVLALEQAAQRGGGVAIPGSVDESTGCGPECYGLIDMMVFGQQLDSTVLEVFFKLNESMIL